MAQRSSIEKMAMLLCSLPEDAAAGLLKGLAKEFQQTRQQSQLKALVSKMASLPAFEPEELDQLLKEFLDFIGDLSLKNSIDPQRSGKDFLRKTLHSSVWDDLLSPFGESFLFSFLDHLPKKQLADFLSKEHPQTIALVMAHMTAKNKADLIKLFSQELQTEVIFRLAKLERVSFEDKEMLAKELSSRLTQNGSLTEGKKLGGVEKAASLLASLDPILQQRILEDSKQRDPFKTEQIKEQLFVFKDVIKLSDEQFKELYKKLDRSLWLLALKEPQEQIMAKLEANLSQRAFSLLKEDLEAQPKMLKKDVLAAQRQIAVLASKIFSS